MQSIYARWKQSRSRPFDEDDIIFHLSFKEGKIFCHVELRFPDIYNYGTDAITHLDSSKLYVCKVCWKKYIKLKALSIK